MWRMTLEPRHLASEASLFISYHFYYLILNYFNDMVYLSISQSSHGPSCFRPFTHVPFGRNILASHCLGQLLVIVSAKGSLPH